MARYNHFSILKYDTILFSELSIGDVFTRFLYKNGRRIKRKAKKTGELSYMEIRSGVEVKLFNDNLRVYR